MNHNIYLRAHTVPVDKKKSKDTRSVDDTYVSKRESSTMTT